MQQKGHGKRAETDVQTFVQPAKRHARLGSRVCCLPRCSAQNISLFRLSRREMKEGCLQHSVHERGQVSMLNRTSLYPGKERHDSLSPGYMHLLLRLSTCPRSLCLETCMFRIQQMCLFISTEHVGKLTVYNTPAVNPRFQT